jgi:uncharacterized protein (UPF0332 family)
MSKVLSTSSLNDVDWAARTRTQQFAALRAALDKDKVIAELKDLEYLNQLKGKAGCDKQDVARWLHNGWSTERLLWMNYDQLEGDALTQAVHWAFPQAYYSTYACLQAFLTATCSPIENHRSTVKDFGNNIEKEKYPDSVSFMAFGERYNIKYKNTENYHPSSSIFMRLENEKEIHSVICSFLKSTRKKHLEKQRENMDFTKRDGSKKVNLSKEERCGVSESLGNTTIMSLLWRMRIRANYDDISTFLSDEIESSRVLLSLYHLSCIMNFIHECFISAVMGINWVESSIKNYPSNYEPLKSRSSIIREVLHG